MSGSGTKQDGPTAGRLRRAVGAVLGTLVSLGMPTVAVATSFTEVTVEDLARASDLVIVGRVEHLEVLPAGPAGQPGIHTRAVIQVSEVLRASGAIEPRTMIEVWVHGGRLGSRMRVVPGQATFSSGEDVALFLFEAGGGLWPTGMGRGKWLATGPSNGRLVPAVRDDVRLLAPRGLAIAELRARVASADP